MILTNAWNLLKLKFTIIANIFIKRFLISRNENIPFELFYSLTGFDTWEIRKDLTSTNLYMQISLVQLDHWPLTSVFIPRPSILSCLPTFSLFLHVFQGHYLFPFVYSRPIFLSSCPIPLVHFGIWCKWFTLMIQINFKYSVKAQVYNAMHGLIILEYYKRISKFCWSLIVLNSFLILWVLLKK